MILQDRLRSAESIEEVQIILGDILCLGGPANEAVARRAVADHNYLIYLEYTKDIPSLKTKILEGVGNQCTGSSHSNALSERREPVVASESPGNVHLIGRAAIAFVSWGATGFKVAEESTIATRTSACERCEYYVDPPSTLVYRGVKLLTGKSEKICSECGCLVSKKVLIPGERCPKQDACNPNVSRWGDPWIQ